MDALFDPGPHFSVFVLLFSTIAGIRLIRHGLWDSARRWRLITGVALITVSFARELPRLIDRPAPLPAARAVEEHAAMRYAPQLGSAAED
ncbi:MAG TPA: hypothetical protein VKW08_02280 [Xanthobacteraceae bacterium]|jgi:hypothetical protein|nr:hypothetical protein [Xanthobacteraceae bacterium]